MLEQLEEARQLAKEQGICTVCYGTGESYGRACWGCWGTGRDDDRLDSDRCGFCGARRDGDCNNASDGISADGAGGSCRWNEDDVIRD